MLELEYINSNSDCLKKGYSTFTQGSQTYLTTEFFIQVMTVQRPGNFLNTILEIVA